MARLWGDNYFNPKTKKWTNKATDADGKQLERAFNLFVLDPIFKIFDATMNNKKEKVFDMLGPLLRSVAFADRAQRSSRSSSAATSVTSRARPCSRSACASSCRPATRSWFVAHWPDRR